MKRNPSNILAMKSYNRALILSCIRRRPISRIEISREVGLTKSAVTMLTNEMIREGLLCEAGLSEKTAAPGRTSILLDIVPDFVFAMGVTLHRKAISVCLTDLKSELICSSKAPIGEFSTAVQAVDWIEASLRKLMQEKGLKIEKCIGIGISSPGPLQYDKGIILEPPDFALFHHVPIVKLLKQRLQLPVYMENNAVALALTEYYRNTEAQFRNTMFVVIADGIGAAVLQDGKVFRGLQGFAGEIGHISIDTDGERCSCGNRGCLELYATMSSLKNRFGFENYQTVVDDACKGIPYACGIMDYLSSHLVSGLVNAINLFDLDAVIFYGEYSYRGYWLAKKLESAIWQQSLICKAHQVKVLPSCQSMETSESVAAAPILNAFFEQLLPIKKDSMQDYNTGKQSR